MKNEKSITEQATVRNYHLSVEFKSRNRQGKQKTDQKSSICSCNSNRVQENYLFVCFVTYIAMYLA